MQESVCIKQGAEARVYHLASFLGLPEGGIVKERFRKTYRHPDLDHALTHRRVAQEARSLFRCKKAGLDTPTVYYVDLDTAKIYMECIVGKTVKQLLFDDQHSAYNGMDLDNLAQKIGSSIAIMHSIDIIHGDLTTSNLMIRDMNQGLAVIDLGLSFTSNLPEDKAVDLYVLERAFSSTHPQTEALFDSVLQQYCQHYKQAPAVLKKLEDVRLRGRKRSMVG